MKKIITILCLLLSVNAYSVELDHLIYNSIEGGSGNDEIVDIASFNDTLYVLMHTDSPGLDVSENAYRKDAMFLQDIYIAKYKVDYDEVTKLEATYFGTDEDDYATDIKVDANGNVFIGGYTNSPQFEIVGGLQNQTISGLYGFVARLSPDLSTLTYSTRIGGSGDDKILAIAFANDGSILFGGETTSNNLPTDFVANQKDYKNGKDGFYGKLNKSGTSIDRLSYLGGNGDDYVKDVFWDTGNLYVLAAASSSDIKCEPSGGFGAFQSKPYDATHGGGFDLLIGKFKDAADVEFLTYYGGDGDEFPTNIWVLSGKTYFSGSTSSTVAGGLDLSGNAANTEYIGGESDFLLGQLDPLASTGQGTFQRFFQELGFATVFGSRGKDTPRSMIYDQKRFAFILTGSTDSKSYPATIGEKNYGGIDGVVSMVSTTGSDVQEEFMIGGLGAEVTVASANINGSFFFATNTNRGSEIHKSWNGLSSKDEDGNDFVISRYSKETINISNPDADDELCISGNLNVSFSRINDLENLPARVTVQKKDDSEFRLVFDNDEIADDFLGIAYEDYPFEAGDYYVKVALINGVYNYVDPITLIPSPEIVETQLNGLDETNTVCEGGSISFEIVDNGFGTSYRWFKNNVAIEGETGKQLIIEEVGPDTEANYRYDVLGQCTPNARSETFSVNVTETVKNLQDIENIKVTDGDPLTVTVEVQGEKLSYEWYKEGEKILGQESKTLSYPKASKAQEGSYQVKVFNSCNEITSNTFTVEVLPNSVFENDNNEFLVYQEGVNIIASITDPISQTPTLFDSKGRIIATSEVAGNNTYIFRNLRQSGVYFIVVQTNEKALISKISYINE